MRNRNVFALMVTALATASLAVAQPSSADISPQYPPGRYHVVEIMCPVEAPCPPGEWGFWTVIDGGPGVIRMITNDGTILDFHRFETGWAATTDDLQYSCVDGSIRSTASQFTIFDTGGNILIVDDWTPENPFCDGLPDDTSSEAQLTPA